MLRNPELNDYLNQARLSVDQAADLLDVAPSTIHRWLERRRPPPYAARMVLKAYAGGWTSRFPWVGRPEWLKLTMAMMGQNNRSTADGIGVWPGPFGEYVHNGTGPKRYILMACEYWLSTAPEIAVKPRGRPAIDHPTDEDDDRRRGPGRPPAGDSADAIRAMVDRPGADQVREEMALQHCGKPLSQLSLDERGIIFQLAREWLVNNP